MTIKYLSEGKYDWKSPEGEENPGRMWNPPRREKIRQGFTAQSVLGLPTENIIIYTSEE